ncbi:MAG: S8 family serine peptidase [Colwellia sp.]|nr:S8 family serine peptidase [Colwellia sp.]
MKILSMALLSISTLALSSSAIAYDTVRLVMSQGAQVAGEYMTKASSSITSGCVVSPNAQVKWCLKGNSLSKVGTNSLSVSGSSKPVVFEVDAQGYSAEDIAVAFNKDGRFGLVEVDVITTDLAIPDDPFGGAQESYFGSPTDHVTGMNIYGLWDALPEGAVTELNDPIDIVVLDSTFVENEESPYFDGRNFSTTALTRDGPYQVPSDSYLPPEELVDLHCSAHGLGVVSTIGSRIGNGVTAAGVTNNANIYAIRTMTCGVGFLSDTSNALLWLAGEHFEGVTPYQGNPGIVNMSLGGKSNGCPSFMQQGIDAAIGAGFTLVVAAGNDSVDVVEQTPANCNGSIVIGALDSSGDLTDFSNFGSGIDVVVRGTDVIALCGPQDNACWWDGTSFSAPLVAGALGVIKQATGLGDDNLQAALYMSSNLDDLGASCQSDDCGEGLPDFAVVLEVAKMLGEGTLHTIEFALGRNDNCEQAWLLDNFSNEAKFCEMYRVSFFGGYKAKGATYELYSIDSDEDWSTAAQQAEGIFDQGTVMLSNLEIAAKQYGFKMCKNGVCGDIIGLDTEMAKEEYRPAACNH